MEHAGILARKKFITGRCWTQLFLQAAVDEGKLQKAAFDDYMPASLVWAIHSRGAAPQLCFVPV